MKKRILSLLLCVVMVFSLVGVASAAGDETFSDVKPGIWFYEYVEDVADLDYFIGYPDGTFQPNGDITRAEIVLVLARMAQRLGLARSYNLNAPIDESPFEDVPTNMWYSAAIKWAADEKITLGMGNNKFAPQAAIAREDACTLICRFIDYVGENKGEYYTKHYNASLISEFVDEDQIRDYAAEAVDVCMAYGIIEGFPDGTFQPRGYWTRAQGAKMISLLHDVLDVPDEPYIPPYNPDPDPDPDSGYNILELALLFGGERTMVEDISYTYGYADAIENKADFVLNMNGKVVTIATAEKLSTLGISKNATIKNGTIQGSLQTDSSWYNGALMVIEGGDLTLDTVVMKDLIVGADGNVKMTGCTLDNSYIQVSGTVEVDGTAFTGRTKTINVSEGFSVELPTYYFSFEKGGRLVITGGTFNDKAFDDMTEADWRELCIYVASDSYTDITDTLVIDIDKANGTVTITAPGEDDPAGNVLELALVYGGERTMVEDVSYAYSFADAVENKADFVLNLNNKTVTIGTDLMVSTLGIFKNATIKNGTVQGVLQFGSDWYNGALMVAESGDLTLDTVVMKDLIVGADGNVKMTGCTLDNSYVQVFGTVEVNDSTFTGRTRTIDVTVGETIELPDYYFSFEEGGRLEITGGTFNGKAFADMTEGDWKELCIYVDDSFVDVTDTLVVEIGGGVVTITAP